MKNQKRLVELVQKKQPAEKEEGELKPSDKFWKFSKVLYDLKQVIEKDTLKAKKLYIKAGNLYIELETEEKKKVYSELTGLYNKLIMLAKEEELKRKKLSKVRKERLIEFFHKTGLYKTPEEKKQIILHKERERQERIKHQEQAKRQKELEEKRKLEEQRRQQLEEEKRKQEVLSKKEELKIQKELEKKRALEEKKKFVEEKNKAEEQEKRQRELEKQKEEQRRKELDQKRKKSEELAKRPTIFGRLFKAKELLTKTQEEKTKEQKSTESEFEELEDAIRNLGLFKKIEKERGGVKESKEKPSIFGKLFKK